MKKCLFCRPHHWRCRHYKKISLWRSEKKKNLITIEIKRDICANSITCTKTGICHTKNCIQSLKRKEARLVQSLGKFPVRADCFHGGVQHIPHLGGDAFRGEAASTLADQQIMPRLPELWTHPGRRTRSPLMMASTLTPKKKSIPAMMEQPVSGCPPCPGTRFKVLPESSEARLRRAPLFSGVAAVHLRRTAPAKA